MIYVCCHVSDGWDAFQVSTGHSLLNPSTGQTTHGRTMLFKKTHTWKDDAIMLAHMYASNVHVHLWFTNYNCSYLFTVDSCTIYLIVSIMNHVTECLLFYISGEKTRTDNGVWFFTYHCRWTLVCFPQICSLLIPDVKMLCDFSVYHGPRISHQGTYKF